MSKKVKNTRDSILNKALELFNERGIEYVGMRELAGVLDIRVSNITYYFPTKDDLVNQLSLDLNYLNSKTLLDYPELTVNSFLDNMEKVFYNQLKYRCLMLSIVHIMEQNVVISTRHKEVQRERNQVLKSNLMTLEHKGLLCFERNADADYLASTISLIARFWISEAAISYKKLPGNEQIKYMVSVIAHQLLPYATNSSREVLLSYIG